MIRIVSKFTECWLYVGVALLAAASLSSAAPRGTAPRSSAGRYHANAQHDGVAIGAELLSAEQTRKTFVSDVNNCCLVVEVALYPQKDKPLRVAGYDFTLSIVGTDTVTKPQSAKVVAASLQKKAGSQRDVTVSPTVGVGYESGTYIDPVTGQQQHAHGVYTSAGVGVGVGAPGTAPGSTDRDRDTMETELTEKGLPEGSASAPVAGYLYFPIAKKKKDAKLLLEYTLNGNKVTLSLP